jgi:superfamily II DNA/RNA helicase
LNRESSSSLEMRRKSERFCPLFIYFSISATNTATGRQKLLEILNSGVYASPIIVFVNQKKTADMVAKDLSRAGVSD